MTMLRSGGSHWFFAGALGMIWTWATPLAASPASRQLTAAAFHDAYDLEFVSSYARLEEAARADPTDPAPPRAVAAIVWMELLFSQGAATYEAFTGQATKNDVARPPAPPDLTNRFQTHIARALQLAENRLKDRPDADAHYQLGASTALAAIYRATVEGRTLSALGDGRRAVKEMQLARKLAPDRHEPDLVLGMSEYTVSTLAMPVRWLAGLTGLSGNRIHALSLLESAASPGAETETDALLLLMIIYNREGRHAESTERLARLRGRFPHNRLLWLNAAATAIDAGQFDAAERHLADGFAARDVQAPPQVTGEHALWLLKRGTARAALGRSIEAGADLARALTVGPRDWVCARTHLELARLALARSETDEAITQLQQAMAFGARGGDDAAVHAAEALLKKTRKAR